VIATPGPLHRAKIISVVFCAGFGCETAIFHDLPTLERPGDNLACPDAAPLLSAEARSDGCVDLSWTIDTSVDQFVLELAETEGEFSLLRDQLTVREFEHCEAGGALRDQNLFYRVKAENPSCPASEPASVRTAPESVTSLSAVTAFRGSEIFSSLDWEDPNELANNCFAVTREPPSATGTVTVASPDEFEDGPLPAETPFTYRVETVFPCPPSRLDSGVPASVEITTPPAPVRDLRLLGVQARRVEIAWSDPNATTLGFDVLRRPAEGPDEPSLIATLDPDQTGYVDTDSNLVPGTTYDYSVVVEAQGGRAPPTTLTVQTTAPPQMELGPPVLKSSCRLDVPGELTLVQTARIAEVSGSIEIATSTSATPLVVTASATGLTIPVRPNVLDLEVLRTDGSFEVSWRVMDTLGGMNEVTRPSTMAVAEPEYRTPVRSPASPAPAFGRTDGDTIASAQGQQTLVDSASGSCRDCRAAPASISMGLEHVCAVLGARPEATRLVCWGQNLEGEAGTGISGEELAYANPRFACDGPGPLTEPDCPELSGIRQVSAGSEFTCVLLANGQVHCTGINSFGQLGSGRLASNGGPLRERYFKPVCATGSHTDGDCVPFGDVDRIQSGGSPVSCAFRTNGEVACWGGFWSNPTTPCATGSIFQSPCPDPLRDVAHVGIGGSFFCFGLDDGTARCVGDNDQGQLGRGTTSSTLITVDVVCESGTAPTCPPLDSIIAIDGGNKYACALRSSGEVWCWGANQAGELGNRGPGDQSSLPVPVCTTEVAAGSTCPASDRLKGVTAIAAGFNFACALLDDGAVQCWGSRGRSELRPNDGTAWNALGDGRGQNPSPRAFAAPVCERGMLGSGGGCVPLGRGPRGSIVALSAGQQAVCAVTERGEILCWGGQRRGIDGSYTGILGHGPSYRGPNGDSAAHNPVPVCMTGQGDGNCLDVNDTLDTAAVRACHALEVQP